MANFFRNKYPYTDFHELNIDKWILMVTQHETRIKDLEDWKTEHMVEFNELKATVETFDDRIDGLEAWRETHEEEYKQLAGIVGQHTTEIGTLSGRMSIAEGHINQLGAELDATNTNLAQAINDSIQRDTRIDQRLIDLISQAGGDGIVFMNENIIAYAQDFRFIDELSAMYDDSVNSDAWYVFEDLADFTANGFVTGNDCYIYIGNIAAVDFPVTLSIKRGGSVYTGSFANSSSSVAINGITCSFYTNSKGTWLKLDTNEGANITSLKLENGLVGTPFNENTFSEYMKIFRNIVKDVIDESIFNTETLTISGLKCYLDVYDRATYPDDPVSTEIGDVTINYQIVNSVVMGQVTVIGDPTLVIDATDQTKVYQIRVDGSGIEDLPISSLQTNVSWERTMIGSSVIRYPGAINAFYQRLVSGNSAVDFLVGNLTGILPAKGFDTTIISFGISYPLPGNIASLDNTDF